MKFIFVIAVSLTFSFTAFAQIKWETDLDSALHHSQTSGKPIFVLFGAYWCAPCRIFESRILTDKRIIAFLNKNFITLEIREELDDRTKHKAEFLRKEKLREEIFKVQAFPSICIQKKNKNPILIEIPHDDNSSDYSAEKLMQILKSYL